MPPSESTELSETLDRIVQSVPALTDEERKILRAYLANPVVKSIARRFKTKAQTVRNQMASIRKKAGVGSNAELLLHLLGPSAGGVDKKS